MAHHILLSVQVEMEESLATVEVLEDQEDHTLFLLNYLLIQDLALVPQIMEIQVKVVDLVMVLNLKVVLVLYLQVVDLVVMVDSALLLILIVGLIHGLLMEQFL